MKYEAVIFDFFGTLVDIFSRAEYDRVFKEMAGALSIATDDFSRAWIAVRIRIPYKAVTDALRVSEESWQGLTVSSLYQVLDLVDVTHHGETSRES